MGRALFLSLAVLPLGVAAVPPAVESGHPHFANGLKIGETSSDSAIVWTRLTQAPERNLQGRPFDKIVRDPASRPVDPSKSQYELDAIWVSMPISAEAQLAGHSIDEMEGAVPGKAGRVRISYWPKTNPEAVMRTPVGTVTAATDFTAQIRLKDLTPETVYAVRAETLSETDGSVVAHFDGEFVTAPVSTKAARVSFTVSTCQDYRRRDDPENGHRIYSLMRDLKPDFFVQTGDNEYYDKPTPLATNLALARFKWNRMHAMPFQRAFHAQVSSYFMKDDHDTLKDDAAPGQSYGDLTWEQGLAIFREQVPMGEKTYRTARWGKDLQIWLLEGRDFRSQNDAPDGPEKSILGEEQKRWLKQTVLESDATFRMIISATPILGPDRERKADNHSNHAFAHEGRELREFIAGRRDLIVITGDRHWQYASVDPLTGLREYSSGPSSDSHAEGFSEDDRTPTHRFLRIKGGFLSIVVERKNGVPQATFRHYGTDGKVYYEDVVLSQSVRQQ